MSREAMEAVQDHTAITDPMGRNVLTAIARFIPANGSEGWASYRVLADVAGCDKDTVSRWVGIIEAEYKEIETRKEGNGRGTRMYYRLLLPLDRPKHGAVVWDNNQNIVPNKDGTITDGDIISALSQQIKLLSQQIELLSQRLELLSPLLSQNVPIIGGTETIETKEETNGKPETPTSARAGNPPPTGHPVWELPKALRTADFEAAWIDWFKHRLENGRYLTQTSGDTILAWMSDIGPERAVAAIRHSIGKGWINIYEPEAATAPPPNGRKPAQNTDLVPLGNGLF